MRFLDIVRIASCDKKKSLSRCKATWHLNMSLLHTCCEIDLTKPPFMNPDRWKLCWWNVNVQRSTSCTQIAVRYVHLLTYRLQLSMHLRPSLINMFAFPALTVYVCKTAKIVAGHVCCSRTQGGGMLRLRRPCMTRTNSPRRLSSLGNSTYSNTYIKQQTTLVVIAWVDLKPGHSHHAEYNNAKNTILR